METISFVNRVIEASKMKLENRALPLFQELMIIKYKDMVESAEEERVIESAVASEPEPEQTQEPEQGPHFQASTDFIPYDEETDVFYSSSAEESTSDEDSLSPTSTGNDYQFNNALYAAIDDDVGYQNQYASSNQDEVPDSLDYDDADYLSSGGTHESESEYIDLASLTPTASQFNDMIYRAHADKGDSSYDMNDAFNNTNDPLECTQNNVAVINSLDVSAIATAIPSTRMSASTDLISSNPLPAIKSSTPSPSVANQDKENKPSYSSRLKRKHGRSFNGADMSENSSKHRRLGGSVSMKDSDSIKANKAQRSAYTKRTGLGCLDNQSTHRANKSSDAAGRSNTRTNSLQDLENQPFASINLLSNVQKQSLQQYISKTPNEDAPTVTAVPQPIIQQATDNNSTAASPKYTTVPVLGKKRTRHERDEYDFYSDYHRPEAKKLFNELLSKDPF
ncbi:hypothetical protein MBANPS3_008142 [Mucor bainieri]